MGRWMRRLVFALLLCGMGAYGGMAGYLYFFQTGMVFKPRKGIEATPEAWGMTYEAVTFESEGHRLHGWWIPGDPKQPVVLFFHGNASVLSGLRDHVERFRSLGLSVFLFDYRGYGLSEGEPGEAAVYADSLAAWNYLTRVRQIPAVRIVDYGHSLGGGAATWLAVRHAPAALILEGTFQSVPAIGEERYPYLPIRRLSRITFDNLERIGQVRVPVLIIHSRDDEVIPWHHGRALFDAAAEPKSFLETRGRHHTSFSQGGAEAEAGLRRFLASL
ncbi:MAG: alpha/beta hydrolase [Magnetococcales bacterium]|nr:alpha/beta hydrolase [Magnetococcales bacterium]